MFQQQNNYQRQLASRPVPKADMIYENYMRQLARSKADQEAAFRVSLMDPAGAPKELCTTNNDYDELAPFEQAQKRGTRRTAYPQYSDDNTSNQVVFDQEKHNHELVIRNT